MKDQKADKMSAWSLLKHLSVHFQWINPREIRFLLNALCEVNKLYTVIKDLSSLFTNLWTNTMAINTNFGNMMELLWKGSESLYKVKSGGKEQLMSWMETLESTVKEIQEANERVGGKANSI